MPHTAHQLDSIDFPQSLVCHFLHYRAHTHRTIIALKTKLELFEKEKLSIFEKTLCKVRDIIMEDHFEALEFTLYKRVITG